jgi:hypothetical protein
MRLDQHPESSCLSGSGLPSPEKGSRWTSRTKRTIRSACARSCSIHQAKSSNAAESNSKLLNDSLERQPVPALRRGQQALLHRLRAKQICGFPLRGDLPPQLDGDDHSSRLPGLVGNDLDVGVLHDFSLPPQRLYCASHADGSHFDPSPSFLKCVLRRNGVVRYCGSSTIVVTISQESPFSSTVRWKYSVSTVLPL